MAGEKSTIARPYAEAIFARAQEAGQLDLWSDMLEFLAAAISDPQMTGVISNPKIGRERMTELMLDIAGGRLTDEGQNLVRLLVANDRLVVVPEICVLYEQLKNESQGVAQVTVTTAYPLNPAEEQALAEALKARLGREVKLTTERDPSLIGGIRVQAGDLVIDGSLKARLQQLATELGI
jgi:F-type H+-transporting ATPase subunit delta